MVSRIVAAAMFLGTVLVSIPTYAESLNPALQEAAVAETGTKANAETVQFQPVAVEAETESSDVDKINLKYIKGYATDTGKIITSPLRWESSEWLKFGMVIGGTASLFLIDNKVKNFAQKNRSSVPSGFASVGNAFGEPTYVFPAVGAAYLYGHLTDDAKVRRVSLLALESLTISGALTEGLKLVAGRHRPNAGDIPMTWHGPSVNTEHVSFSSGHTALAFSLATVIAGEYKDTPYVAPAAYGLATLTALARIYKNEHWVSDTFFGAALGHFVSKAVLSYHKKDKKKLARRLSIMPQVGKEMTGLTVNYTF